MTDSSRASQSSEENGVPQTPRTGKLDNYSECFESDAESEATLRMKRSSVIKATAKKSRNHQKMKHPSKSALRITPCSDIEQKILSVRKLHNNELRNMNGDLLLQIEKQKDEIRLLKRMELRQAKIIDRYDSNKCKLPSLIDSHHKELRVLREQLRHVKVRYRKSEESLREADAEIERTRNKLNKYKMLLDEEQLIDRAELNRRLVIAEQRSDDVEKKIQNLQNHTEHLLNNHKHEVNIEKNQNKKLRNTLQGLTEKFSCLELQLLEKEKELEVWNIYSNRQKAIASKLNGSLITPRSTPPVKNKFNERMPPMTPPSLRIKKYEEGRKQKELKRAQEKLTMKNYSTAQNTGDTKNSQNILQSNKTFDVEDLDSADIVSMSERNGYTEKTSEKVLEESKEEEEEKKGMRFTSESYEQEQNITEWIGQIETDSKQMENRKKAEKMSVNDDLDNRLDRSGEEMKPKEEIPKKASEDLKEVSSNREMIELKQKQEDERRRKDILLARLKEIDDNPEMPFKPDGIFSNEDMLGKANKNNYSFSQKTENLHHGRPVNEHSADSRNSSLTLKEFSERVTTPLEMQNDLFLLKKNNRPLEDIFTSNLQRGNGAIDDSKWHQNPIEKNKSSFFNELFEDTTEDNLPRNGEFLSFNCKDRDSNNVGASEPTIWDVGNMLRNDSRNNDKHSAKLLPARQQISRPTLNSLDNSMDSVEEIIL